MLNPQKWVGSTGSGGAQLIEDKDGEVIFDVPTADDEKSEEPEFDEKRASASSVTRLQLQSPRNHMTSCNYWSRWMLRWS
jgi:hypothetical protein